MISVRKWMDMVQVTGVYRIQATDWSACFGGWTLFQLEPEFYPELDLLLYARVGRHIIPVIIMSNGHAIVLPAVGLSCGKLVKFDLTYSMSFGGRLAINRNFGAIDTRFRYPSASRHDNMVALSGVLRCDNMIVTSNTMPLGRLPITYHPEYDCHFLCMGLKQMYLVTVTTGGDILLHIKLSREAINHGLSREAINHGLSREAISLWLSLDSIFYIADNTLPSLSLNRCLLKTNGAKNDSLIATMNCGLVVVHGSARVISGVVTVLPEAYWPKSKIVRLVATSSDSTFAHFTVAKLVINTDGIVRIETNDRSPQLCHLDFHYFITPIHASSHFVS